MYGGSGAMLLPGQSVCVRCRGAVPECLTAAFLTGPGGGRSGFWPLGGAQSTAFLWLWFPGGATVCGGGPGACGPSSLLDSSPGLRDVWKL